jgi:DNA-binding transcriptional MerR regulator
VLRDWEKRFTQLRPKRDRRNQRVYTERDLTIARRIRELMRDERMTARGAGRALARELAGEAPPKTRHETAELIDRIESQARSLLELLDDAGREDNDAAAEEA